MTEEKKKVDMHVKLGSSILETIKQRKIDKLQDIEDELLQHRTLGRESESDLKEYLRIRSVSEE
jgi:hypothetical protein